MPSTYSTSLRLELQADGENAGTWGSRTNTNLGTLLEQSIAGWVTIAISGNIVLTALNGLSDQARNAVLNLTNGGVAAPFTVTVPAHSKLYIFDNQSGQTATITGGGTTLAIATGRRVACYTDTSGNVTEQINAFVGAVTIGGALTLPTSLAVAQGGTGSATLTSNNVLLGNGTSAVAFVAPGTSKNILLSNGTTWTSSRYSQPTRTVLTSGAATYTTPAGATRINIRLVGGGGGGAGSGSGPGLAAAGGNTTFSTLTGSGGAAALANAGGGGGAAAGGDINIAGGVGAQCASLATSAGGQGASTPFGGGGCAGAGSTGGDAPLNTGAGGGGAGSGGVVNPGGGGGAGGYVEKLITSPAASYSYSVGAVGAGGSGGTSGAPGGSGGSGIIIVDEFYN